MKLNKVRQSWCHLLFYYIIYCSTCFRCYYIHPQELATYLLSYVVGCTALVRCVLVLRCGLAGVVWYPDAGWSLNIRLLIYIVHLLDKYNKILRNSRYVLYIKKTDRNFCGETVLEDQKMDAIEMVKERGYRDDNSKVKWENGQTQWA